MGLQRSSVVAVLYLLDVVAWIIILGGISAWQYQCNTSDINTTDRFSLCYSASIQLNWWATWFQFFVLIFLFVVYFSRQATSYRVALMTLLAMVTTLMFSTTNTSFDFIKGAEGDLQSATQAYAAGSIITMICNMLLIIIVGGDLGDLTGSGASTPAQPMSHQEVVNVQMSGGSFAPAYGTKPQV